MNISQSKLNQTIAILFEKVRQAPSSKNLDLEAISKAIEFGKKAHLGQKRKSGECFYIHPVRVAIKAVEYDLDTTAIVGALLHDILEDTEVGAEQLRDIFGEIVTSLVKALTKVSGNKNLTLKKIFLLGKSDFRVVIVKLLDRLDNLSDLGALSRAKQKMICEETSAVYVEVAHGLGLTKIEGELKKNVFRVSYFKTYKKIIQKIEQLKGDRAKAIDKIMFLLREALKKTNFTAIEPQFVQPEDFLLERREVFNVLKSIVIETEHFLGCYEILGVLHLNFRSIPLCIRDYISNPKANGWRGLETKLLVNGEQIPIFIITHEFKEKNDKGILPLIKEGIYSDTEYHNFLDLYLNMASDSVRVEDIFRMRKTKVIQVLTPKGSLVELRYGSTITDFAFMVHTDIGLKCAGGIIDNTRYPRSKIIEDGMVVQIVTDNSVNPDQTWLSFLIMPKAIKETLKFLKLVKAPKKPVKLNKIVQDL